MNLKPKTILRQLNRLSQIEPKNEAAQRALANARATLAGLAAEPARPLPSDRTLSFLRSRQMFTRVAAVVLACAAIVAIMVVFSSPGGHGQLAFAQVVEKVQQTQSVTFKIKGKNLACPAGESIQFIILSDGMSRWDSSQEYRVEDIKTHKFMEVDKKNRTANIIEGYLPRDSEKEDIYTFYEMLRNIRKEAVEHLPDEEIDGRMAMVFRVKIKEAFEVDKTPLWKVWVDPKTELPIRIEMQDENGKTESGVMYEIEFDQPFDSSLFSFAPPEGYTVRTEGHANFPDLPDKLELRAPGILPGVGLGALHFGMSQEEIESLLGKPDGYDANRTSLRYYSRGFILSVSRRNGLKRIECMAQSLHQFRVRDFAGKMKEGIGIGSTLQEVEKAFGKPEQHSLHDSINDVLNYHKLGLTFVFAREKVVTIHLADVLPQADEPSNESSKSFDQKAPKTATNTLRVKVLGPDGKPMAGARINVGIWAKEPTGPNRNYLCDAQGQTIIEYLKTFDALRLFTFCDGYVPLLTGWEELDENPPESVTIQLIKGTSIGGFVKNVEGMPIVGAKVEVMLSSDFDTQQKYTKLSPWSAEGAEARITDAEGQWTLNNIPQGDVKLRLKITHPDYLGDKEWGDLQKEQKITLEELRKQNATLIMHRKK